MKEKEHLLRRQKTPPPIKKKTPQITAEIKVTEGSQDRRGFSKMRVQQLGNGEGWVLVLLDFQKKKKKTYS